MTNCFQSLARPIKLQPKRSCLITVYLIIRLKIIGRIVFASAATSEDLEKVFCKLSHLTFNSLSQGLTSTLAKARLSQANCKQLIRMGGGGLQKEVCPDFNQSIGNIIVHNY